MTDTEKAILGALLLNNKLFHENLIQDFHFLSGSARVFYRAIRDIIAKGGQADLSTLNIHVPGRAGEVAALTSGAVVGNRSYQLACERQVQAWQWSSLKAAVAEVEQLFVDGTPQAVESAISTLQGRLTALSNATADDDIQRYSDAIVHELNEMERRMKLGGEIPGITTGLPGLDGKILGFNPGRSYIIGARPSVGKSALMLKMSLSAAKSGAGAGVVSVESTRSEYAQRSIATEAKIDSRMISSGFSLARSDMERILGMNCELPIYIYDHSADLDRICSVIRKMVLVHGVKIVFVDYIQLIEKIGKYTKHEKVMIASTTLKQLAKQLNIPIVILAQLDREADTRPPRMSDVQWASQIEQDADTMLLLERLPETLPTLDGRKPDDEWIRVHVAKNRDGSRGIEIDLRYTPRYLRFAELNQEVPRGRY